MGRWVPVAAQASSTGPASACWWPGELHVEQRHASLRDAAPLGRWYLSPTSSGAALLGGEVPEEKAGACHEWDWSLLSQSLCSPAHSAGSSKTHPVTLPSSTGCPPYRILFVAHFLTAFHKVTHRGFARFVHAAVSTALGSLFFLSLQIF